MGTQQRIHKTGLDRNYYHIKNKIIKFQCFHINNIYMYIIKALKPNLDKNNVINQTISSWSPSIQALTMLIPRSLYLLKYIMSFYYMLDSNASLWCYRLSLRDTNLEQGLKNDCSTKHLALLLMSYSLDSGYLDRLIFWLTDIDSLIKKEWKNIFTLLLSVIKLRNLGR